MTDPVARHERAKRLFLDLCDLPLAQRAERLAALRDEDPDLVDEVGMLLGFHDAEAKESDVKSSIELAPGTVLDDRYRVVARLGRGGMGDVYRVDDLVLGEPAALKFLRPDLADSGHLRREVRVARQVTHPNVCRVFDVGEVDGRPYLTMEWVDGEDLASLLQRIGRLPTDRGVALARQLAAGLAAAHARGVLHRDLKPANILIDPDGRAKIADFGIAEGAAGADPLTLGAGTPAYMAPELLEGGAPSPATDLYALGLVLYESCTGQYPFEALGRRELARAHRVQKPAPPSAHVDELDPRLERWILRCLEKDPEDRPASALLVAASLPGGGDALDLAAAVGATPSPELVAAAGGGGRLDRRPAIGLGLTTLVLTLATLLLAPGARRLDDAGLDQPPEVMAARAGDLLAELGWDLEAGDRAWGYLENPAALTWMQDGAEPPASNAPGASSILFWYRQSPVALIASDLENLVFGRGQVGPWDPPVTAAGSALLLMHPAGWLDHLEVRPDDSTGPAIAPEVVLAAAGLDPERLVKRPTDFVPDTFSDARAAWRGTTPQRPELQLEATVASAEGRPVAFRLRPAPSVDPEAQDAASADDLGETDDGVEHDATDVLWSVIEETEEWFDLLAIVALFVALPLARENLRLGRGDRRGARRLAALLAGASFVEWLMSGPHFRDVSAEWATFHERLGQALVEAAFVWIFYLAVEPAVRRRLPHVLIAWTRLIRGRPRDPLVGRGLAVGATFGAGWALVEQVDLLLPRWLGLDHWPLSVASLQLDFALDTGRLAGTVVLLGSNAVYDAVFSLLILALLLAVTRRPWLAAIGYTALFTALYSLQGAAPEVSWATVGLIVAATESFLLLRFGLLAFAAAAFSFSLLRYLPLTTDLDAWYAGAGFLGVALTLALGAAGLATASFPGSRPATTGTRARTTSTL
ncbi:MAG: serine/threonine-protein kinase [Acidobacteriota bacterium]